MKNNPQNIKDITIFENDYYLVVDKPYGMTVNDSSTTRDVKTIQTMMREAYFTDLSKFDFEKDKEFLDRNGLIHRLDKETSGVLVLAKDADFFRKVQSQFKERKVKKEYIALTYCDRPIPAKDFTVDAPIARNPTNRTKFAVVEDGRNALTDFKVLEEIKSSEGNFLVVRCFPKTGRTHQIRVHLAALGYSVLGDKLYSGRVRTRKHKDKYKRQMLHAAKIAFIDPVEKKEVSFEADLPDDMKNMVNWLKTI